MLPNRDGLLLWAYWLSPIVLLATYGLGLNDIIPVLLLSLSLYFASQRQMLAAGVFCVAAISAKLSMVLALPFFLIYLFNNRALRQLMPDFIRGGLIALLVFGLPFMFSPSALYMLFSNPELGKVYQFSLSIGNGILIYIMPLSYLLMLYAAWRVRRLNFQLFQSILGMSFLLVVLLTPALPGWFVWAMPLLVSYQMMSDRMSIVLSAMFATLYVVNTLLISPPMPFAPGQFDLKAYLPSSMDVQHAISVLHTAIVAIGLTLAVRIWREMVSHNDYFRLSRKPFVIGVAGDSGAGKSVFVESLSGLFGKHSVISVSEDNYRLWDQQRPIWKVMTHLNPMGNDLERFANDLLALIDGKRIDARCYDHETGKLGHLKRLESSDFILVSGLHGLYLPIMRNCYNLSVYLDMNEELRRHFMLRSGAQGRGEDVSDGLAVIERQQADADKFIRPQKEHADLVLSLQPINARALQDAGDQRPVRYKLVARSRNGLNELALTRILIGVCGLHVDMVVSDGASETELTIEGETTAEDIAMAAGMLCPRTLEFMDIHPQWQDGVAGLMQLITLSHINQAMSARLI
jgi:uridine kinase